MKETKREEKKFNWADYPPDCPLCGYEHWQDQPCQNPPLPSKMKKKRTEGDHQ